MLRVVAIFAVALAASAALAAPPKITRLSVRGLQTGGTTRIAVQGTDLLPEPRLLIPEVTIAEQKLVGTPRANSIEFDVTLDKTVAAGVYHLRLVTTGGVSTPEIITVDHLPQRAVGPAASNSAAEKLPVALHGLIAGAQVQEAKFEGTKGQAVIVDVLAQRLGSKLRPVVTLADAAGRQIAAALPESHLAGDARFEVALPADGVYTLAVHDLAYAGAAPGYYRLSIGQFDYVDQVYPSRMTHEPSGEIELVGRFGDAAASKVDVSKLAAAGSAVAPLPWPAGAQPIGLRARIEVGEGADLVEDRTLGPDRRLPTPPPGIGARLGKPGEQDSFHFAVKPGEKWRFEVYGTRIGSPIDASLELRGPVGKGGAGGARLAQNDDAPGADPRTTVPDPKLEYTVAAGVTEVTAVVSDAYGRGGPEMIYRLTAVRMDGPDAAVPDFALRLFEDTHLVPAAGSKVFRVEADRAGYEGPIRLTVEGVPAGFTASPAEIAAGSGAALVEIRRAGPNSAAKPNPFAVGRLAVVGEAVGLQPPHDKQPIRRTAVVGTSPMRTLQPWLAVDVAVAPTTFAHEFGVEWEGTTSAAATSATRETVLLGKDRKLTVRFRRGPGAVGPIRLSLLTSQVPVLVNGQPNPMQVLRGPAATVDVPLDPTVKQAFDTHAAAEKALAQLEAMPTPKPVKPGEPAKADPKREADLKAARAKLDEAAKKLAEAQAKLKPTFDYTLSIPADLPTIPYQIVLKAELRSVDNQTTLAEAFTPVKQPAISAPVELALSAEAPTVKQAPRDARSVTIRGQVVRLEDFAGDVTVAIVGLPAGITAPRQVLKAEEGAFALEIVIPATFKLSSLKDTKLEGLRVTASLVPDARRANVTTSLEKKLPAFRLKVPAKIAAAETPEKFADKPEPPAAVASAKPAAKPTQKPAETKAAAPKK